MKTIQAGEFARYNGPRHLIHDFQEHNNVFLILEKYDENNKTYPSYLWRCRYRGCDRLIMEQDLEIIEDDEKD